MDLRSRQIFVVILLCVAASQLSSTFAKMEIIVATLVSGVFVQAILLFGQSGKGWWKSAFISCLSLVLLLRVSNPSYYLVAMFLALGSKVIFRDSTGRHFFNPSNFAIVFLLIFSEEVWLDHGYWGRELVYLLIPVSLFLLVSSERKVYQTSLVFLAIYLGMGFLRNLYIGDPFNIFIHQYLHVSLFVFAFFMISDPRTTPNAYRGKVLFCFMVSLFAIVWDGILYLRNGLFMGLFFTTMFTPLINKIFIGEPYQWKEKSQQALSVSS